MSCFPYLIKEKDELFHQLLVTYIQSLCFAMLIPHIIKYCREMTEEIMHKF